MLKPLSLILTAVVCAAITSGCGKSESASAIDSAAFQSASPAMKAQWDAANAALATNNFATAILTFKRLQGQSDLTPEQRESVNNAMTTANQRLGEAMERGDPNITNQMEEIRSRWRSN